jgi:leucyl/phenylalanyl-tRNA--protein transferase
VLFPERLRISRSLAKTLRQVRFRVTADTRFRQVIQACAAPRGDRLDSGTWITAEMIEAYCDLHEYGVAHSIESWLDDKMVGGLYGIALGRVFFGESMFSTESNASKVAFVHLVRHLQKWGYHMIDCQMPSGHLSRFGAEAIGRAEFTQRLAQGLAFADELDCWKLDSEIDLNP